MLCCRGNDLFPQRRVSVSGQWNKTSFLSYCAGALITISGVTTKMDLTVSRLLHNVDIVVSVIWLKYINPLTDWYSGNVFMPNFIPSALFVGTRLSAEHEIGIVRVFSSWRGCEKMSKWGIHYWLFWNPLHSDIIQIRCRISCRGEVVINMGWKKLQKVFAKVIYSIASYFRFFTREKIEEYGCGLKKTDGGHRRLWHSLRWRHNSPWKVRNCGEHRIAVPEGCNERIALLSGFAVKEFIRVGAVIIDAGYPDGIGTP